VGGGHPNPDRKEYDRGSTIPGEVRDRMRNDCEDGGWGAGDLPTCRHDAKRGTRGAPKAAAAPEAQTAGQTGSLNRSTYPNVSDHRHQL